MDDAALVRVASALATSFTMPTTSVIGSGPSPRSRAERLALDERHRVEGEPVGVAGREDGNDVRLLQRGDRADLALEALGAEPECQLGRQHLHHDLALEAQLLGDEHAAHATAAELVLQAVGVTERCLELASQVHGQVTTSLWKRWGRRRARRGPNMRAARGRRQGR